MTASPSDLQAAVESYLAAPTPTKREAAVLAGVPLVRSILGKVTVPDHPLASMEDLESAGLVGLVEALDAYDPAQGTRFMTYAYLRVRGAIIDYLRSLDVLSMGKRKQVAEAGAVADALRQETGAEPSDRAVAERLGISLADYDALMMEAQARFALSLHAPAGDDGTLSLHDVMADADAEAGFSEADHDHTLERVQRSIEGLPQRTRAIIGLYYDEGLTLRQIGEVFGVTEARISQILGKAMLTLRACLEEVAA
ncbi:MAG: sigma-70 family RNA polymerase sigma factor [Bacteroidota bacterium]